jgi:N-ethylmaleimide reductase
MKLFEQATLGKLNLKNRIVMAPMTRSRCIGNIPGDIVSTYYSQRASAGLIITEGISPSANGLGYARIPGLFNDAQMEAWKKVTQSVHQNGGKIFAQLMHTGRASHSLNLPANAKIMAPSALALSGTMWTDSKQMQPYPVPSEMTIDEIKATIKEYVHSAELAIKAGFDGVELHGANGYLIEQFLNPNCNQRKDEYGSNSKGYMRFALEVAGAVAKAIGPERTGIRISPYGVFNDTGAFDQIDSFYKDFVKELSQLKLVYLHVVDHSSMGAPEVSKNLKQDMRDLFKGAYILSGGYSAERAEVDLKENRGDLVAFGRPFIANPNLVEKLKKGLPLKDADPSTFYTPGPVGYSDYQA